MSDSRMIISRILLLIVVSCLATSTAFLRPPEASTYFEGHYFPCHCQGSATSLFYVWRVDGTVIVAETRNVFLRQYGSVSVMEILCTGERNMSMIECGYQLPNGTFIFSQPVVMRVQGTLDPVINVIVESSQTIIELTWDPPFSFNITELRPPHSDLIDTSVNTIITYIVEVSNTNTGESYQFNTTNIGFNFSMVNPDPSHTFEFIITARNNAGMGVPSDPVRASFEATKPDEPTADVSSNVPDVGTDPIADPIEQSGIPLFIIVICVTVSVVVLAVMGGMGLLIYMCRHRSQIKDDKLVPREDCYSESSRNSNSSVSSTDPLPVELKCETIRNSTPEESDLASEPVEKIQPFTVDREVLSEKELTESSEVTTQHHSESFSHLEKDRGHGDLLSVSPTVVSATPKRGTEIGSPFDDEKLSKDPQILPLFSSGEVESSKHETGRSRLVIVGTGNKVIHRCSSDPKLQTCHCDSTVNDNQFSQIKVEEIPVPIKEPQTTQSQTKERFPSPVQEHENIPHSETKGTDDMKTTPNTTDAEGEVVDRTDKSTPEKSDSVSDQVHIFFEKVQPSSVDIKHLEVPTVDTEVLPEEVLMKPVEETPLLVDAKQPTEECGEYSVQLDIRQETQTSCETAESYRSQLRRNTLDAQREMLTTRSSTLSTYEALTISCGAQLTSKQAYRLQQCLQKMRKTEMTISINAIKNDVIIEIQIPIHLFHP